MTSAARNRARWPRVVLMLVTAIFMVVCLWGLEAVRRKPRAIFNVTATTERVAFELNKASPRRWTFQHARLETTDKTIKDFTGSIELGVPVQGFIERVAEGPLWVHVECKPKCTTFGRAFDNTDAPLFGTGQSLDVWIDDVKGQAARGITTVLTLAGTVTPGREVGVETLGSTAVLRGGSVAVLVETAFGDQRFEARRELLEAGDLFRVNDPDQENPTDGFVVADERPALTAAYRVGGQSGHRQRPGGASYVVAASMYQRVLHDDFFQMLSGLLAFIGALAGLAAEAAGLKFGGG